MFLSEMTPIFTTAQGCLLLRHPELVSGSRRFIKGFTLIELLVVVLIIGILAAVALPQYQMTVYKSQYATLKSLTKVLADAQEIYYLANGMYATNCAALDMGIDGKTAKHSALVQYFSDGLCVCEGKTTTCQNSKTGMKYRIYGQHIEDSLKPGSRACLANNGDLNSLQNKICKQETGATTPFYHPDTNTETAWRYQ